MFDRIRQKINRNLTGTRLNRAAGLLFFPGRPKSGVADITQARGILVLKPDGIGDVILSTGFLRSLRRQCPQAHITIAVREVSRELVEFPCFCNDILIWKESWHGDTLKPGSALDLARSARIKWKSKPLDWVLIPRSGWDHANAAMYAWWSGAPNICAHEFFCQDRGLNRHGFVNHLIPTLEMAHETEFHRRMLQFLKLDSEIRPRLEISAPAGKKIAGLFSPGIIRSNWMAFGIGASHGSKRWPTENFRRLAQSLSRQQPDLTIFLIGGMDDREIARAIGAGSAGATVDVTGQLSLAETAALLKHCGAFVGNDSGPIHLAGAAGCMVVEISKHPPGGNPVHECSPVRFGPVAGWSCVLQPIPRGLECQEGCNEPEAHCITNITVDQVMNAVSRALVFAGVKSKIVNEPAEATD
jgi:ADP-heptose:LPS heptosyltransferase